MVICQRCRVCVREGDMVRVTLLARFSRVNVVQHGLDVYDEESLEHMDCKRESLLVRLRRWVRRLRAA